MASTEYNRSWRCRFVLLEYLRKGLPGSALPEPRPHIGQHLLVMFRKVPSRYLGIRTERPQTCWELAWPTVALLQPPHLDWRSRANWPLFRPDQSLRHSPRLVFGYIRLLLSSLFGATADKRLSQTWLPCSRRTRTRLYVRWPSPLLPTQPRQTSLQDRSPSHRRSTSLPDVQYFAFMKGYPFAAKSRGPSAPE